MKTRIDWASLLGFAIVAGLSGVFYTLADFGKALSKQCGLLQLVGAIILCIGIFAKKNGMLKFCGSIVLAITLGQVVALYYWLELNWVTAELFGRYLSLGWFGFLLHAAFAIWGGILVVKTLSSQKTQLAYRRAAKEHDS